jgi:Fe-S-cluster containining protein
MTGKIKSNEYCKGCPAICCTNLAMEIGKPENKKEVEDLKWQLQFDTVKVYIRKNRWYQLVEGRCMYLSEDNFCTIYKQRPKKCRTHNPPNCERYGKYYDVMLENPKDLEKYLTSKKRNKYC